jgi:hypothetical protein
LSRRVGTDVLVTTPTDDGMHELSGGATAVWDELRVPRTVVDLVDRLASAHGEEPSEIAAQVEGCLNTLVDLGVVGKERDSDG